MVVATVAIVVVIVVVIIAALVMVALLKNNTNDNSGGGNPAVTVEITGVNWNINGCGWSSYTGNGGTFSGGQQITFTSQFTYSSFLGLGTCTISSVSISTPGFSLVSSNTPLTFSGSGTQTLSVTVNAPTSAFTGVVTLSISTS
jgi:hypothetical protein